ncbi:MAG TPA: dipeptidase [Bacteroidota bacterium]|nr:dipeptidase [Bacteroidota bacterium]
MKDILRFFRQNRNRYLSELKDLIVIPSVSTDPAHRKDIRRCAGWLSAHLKSIGMRGVKIFPTKGHPIVYAEWLGAPGAPTVLLYGHYDVQPVDPLNLWTSPPFRATIRKGNIYARGTADDKGQVLIHLKGIEAFLKIRGKLPVNLKMILEGEEEIGSEHLGGFVKSHKKLLRADVVVISDTSMFARGVPSLCYGLRGLSYMQIDLTGPNKDLHSGSFGGSVHNPVQALAEIIAKLHDGKGRVTVPGFYRKVRKLTAKERSSFRKLPWNDRKYARELGVKALHGETGFTTLERLWARPTLECNGVWGGFTGKGAKTVLPSKASAKISMRLVPDQKAAEVAGQFTSYIKKIAPKTCTVKISYLHGGEAAITPLGSPGVRAAVRALEKGFGKRVLYQREGGSIPIVVQFKEILGLETVLLGFGLPDENAHAPDEFINLNNFFGGIRTVAHFYNELPRFYKQRRGGR